MRTRKGIEGEEGQKSKTSKGGVLKQRRRKPRIWGGKQEEKEGSTMRRTRRMRERWKMREAMKGGKERKGHGEEEGERGRERE